MFTWCARGGFRSWRRRAAIAPSCLSPCDNTGNVLIGTGGTTSTVVADAVRFVKQ